jgi:hypothetical protein
VLTGVGDDELAADPHHDSVSLADIDVIDLVGGRLDVVADDFGSEEWRYGQDERERGGQATPPLSSGLVAGFSRL